MGDFRRQSFVIEAADDDAVRALAKLWNVSVASVLREAITQFLRAPQRPHNGSERVPGPRAEPAGALHHALLELREAGAQPSQLALAQVRDLIDDVGPLVGGEKRAPQGTVVLRLQHVGRYRDLQLELDDGLRAAVATVMSTNREPGDLKPDAPLLVRADGRAWSPGMISRAIKRGREAKQE